jgi:tetraacyldisaccharide 4'-kinase
MAGGTAVDAVSKTLRGILIPASVAYAFVLSLRAVLYRIGLLKTHRLPCPVISIGNITVGGTGKTPVTAHIARMLMARGLRVAVLSRGYGGSLEGQTALVSDGLKISLTPEQCGDEPFFLAEGVPGLAVIIGSDRFAAGQLAISELDPDVFLLDDGFQHLRLHRDLNILLLDCVRPFGSGWTLPAGVLREPKRAAGRADLVVLTRCPEGALPQSPLPGKPYCCARHELSDLVPLAGGEPFGFEELRGRNVVAFSGIAEPQLFLDGLRKLGLQVIGSICFPDHVVYDEARLAEVEDLLKTTGADFAITTEKDGVKLGRLRKAFAQRILLARLNLVIADPTPLTASLLNLLQK